MSILEQATDMLKELFEYNRDNFTEDREQRQIMEYDLMSFRIEQVNLWREDIREIAELTPEKLEIYLLVIALELGFCVMALCKGRVPPGAPPWLVACHTVAVIAAFVYLLLAFWFAMHAFVSAQAYKVRILTQLVRLPVPTWRQMEASRTYGSAFERLGRKQLLRIPFLNPQEKISRCRACTEEEDSSPRRATPAPQTLLEEGLAADPWGLERRGDGIPELAPDVNTQAERQRHIWLIREASKFYQTYDAFSRVSMSAGTCSLATFMCYYCLSYVLTENAAPAAAWGGMIVFSGSAVVIMVNDMQLRTSDFCVLLLLKFVPPALSAIVTFRSSKNAGDPGDWEYLMPVALLAHGLSELYYLLLFRVREVQTGALLPLAFRGLLFLDPFAWAKHTGTWHKRLRQSLLQQGKLPQWHASSFALGNCRANASSRFLGRSSAASRGEFGLFSRSRILGLGSNASMASNESTGYKLAPAPSMEVLASSEPRRPEDVAGLDDEAPESMSFRPHSFAATDCEPAVERVQFSTGTDIHGEFPGLVPWKVFFCNTTVLTLMWWFAAGVALVNARKGAAVFVSPNYGLEDGVVAPMADIRIAGSSEMHFGMRFSTKWGDSTMMAAPRGLTCDTTGKIFATIRPTIDGHRDLFHGRLEDNGVHFAPSPVCQALEMPVQDVAFTECIDVEAGNCSAHMLSHSGKLITCPLSEAAGSSATDRPLSRSWLQDRGGVPPIEFSGQDSSGLLFPEEFSSISAVPCMAPKQSETGSNTTHGSASGNPECFVVGTTARRMVQVEQHGGAFVPRRLLRLDSSEVPGAGSLGLLKGRYVGMLIQGEGVLQMLDMEAGGRIAGTWRLPHLRTQKRGGRGQWAGICGGGDSFFVLEDGDDPGIWRFPLPELQKPAIIGSGGSGSSSPSDIVD